MWFACYTSRKRRKPNKKPKKRENTSPTKQYDVVSAVVAPENQPIVYANATKIYDISLEEMGQQRKETNKTGVTYANTADIRNIINESSDSPNSSPQHSQYVSSSKILNEKNPNTTQHNPNSIQQSPNVTQQNPFVKQTQSPERNATTTPRKISSEQPPASQYVSALLIPENSAYRSRTLGENEAEKKNTLNRKDPTMDKSQYGTLLTRPSQQQMQADQIEPQQQNYQEQYDPTKAKSQYGSLLRRPQPQQQIEDQQSYQEQHDPTKSKSQYGSLLQRPQPQQQNEDQQQYDPTKAKSQYGTLLQRPQPQQQIEVQQQQQQQFEETQYQEQQYEEGQYEEQYQQ